MSYKAKKDVTAAGDILLYLKNGVGGDGSRKHRMVLERTVSKDTHGQAGRVDSCPLPEKICPGSG
ncbi:MAG: hypothetical protein IJI14_16480 [Anaerolineaceae bacterium]|nr:hypothetical protein [Anaerolineaceae bacterium]